MWTLPAADRLALLDLMPAAEALRRELANGFHPSSRDEVQRHVLLKTGSEAAAESAGFAWQMAQALAGNKVT